MQPSTLLRTLVRSWVWLHLVALAALLLQPSQPATFLGRYSKTAVIAIALAIPATPLVVVVTRWLDKRFQGQEASQHHVNKLTSTLMFAVSLIAIIVMWFAPLGPTTSYIVVRLYLTAIFITIGLWAVVSLAQVDQIRLGRVTLVCLIGTIVAIVLSARQIPGLLWTDEGFETNLALSWAQHGKIAVPFFLNARIGSIYSLVYYGLGQWFSLFGVHFEVGRFFILLIGFATVGVIYKTVALMSSSRVAILTALISLYPIAILNWIRADIGVAFYMSVALYAIVRARIKQQSQLFILAGLFMGWSLDGHPSAYRFMVAFSFAMLIEYGYTVWQSKRIRSVVPFAYFVGGEIIGLAIYIGFYMVLSGDAFLETLKGSGQTVGMNPMMLPERLMAQMIMPLQEIPLIFGMAILGLVVALYRRNFTDRLFLLVVAVSTLIISITFPFFRLYYVIHSIPLYALLAAGVLGEIERHVTATTLQARWPAIQAVLSIFLVAANAAWLFYGRGNGGGYGRALQVAEKIREIVPSDETFVGIDPFYLEMSNYPSFIELNAASLVANHENRTEREVWEQIAPTSITIVTGYPIGPSDALMGYIADHHLQKARCWEVEVLGRVDLYMQTVPANLTPNDQCEVIQ